MDWVSFDEIKRTVSLQMVLDHYGVRLRHVGPNTLRGQCPLPTHGSKTSSGSFTATLNKGTGGAWACQSASCIKARGRVGGNALDFVSAMEQCSIRDAAIKLQTWFLVPAAGKSAPPVETKRAVKSSAVQDPEQKLAVKEKLDAEGEAVSNATLTFELQNIDHAHPYLTERGLTEKTARQFGVGVFPGKGSMQGRCVIPIHNPEGQIVAYAGRAIDGTEPRYKFPAGFHKSLELFNLHRVRGELTVVLVEGFFDCIKVTQAGLACVALMGSTMSSAQEDLLAEHFGHVIVMLDGDEAGRSAAEEIADRLRRVTYQIDVISLPDGVQPDILSVEQIVRVLK